MSDPAVPIALSERAHDRLTVRRTDERWLEQAWSSPATRVLPVARTRFPAAAGAAAWVPPAAAPAGERVLLGEQDGVAHFAVLTDTEPPQDWVGLRQVAPALVASEAGLVVHAVALAQWRGRHRYCPRCAGVLEPAEAGHVLVCPGCGGHQFPRADPAVIMVVTNSERCLLGHQRAWPTGRYSTLAGFVEPGESLEDAVRREVAEEVGVEVGTVDYFGNQPWPFPASLMVGFVAHAETTEVRVDGAEIADARWFTRDQMAAEAQAGTLRLPGGVSIARSLVESWYGGSLPGRW